MSEPVLLLILDGWGHAPPGPGNAVSQAKTPHLTTLLATCPHTLLACMGEAVGLPPGQMGNSEVGHLNLGAGRVVYQDIMRINKAVDDGSLAANPVLLDLIHTTQERRGRLHCMGLVSDGGVHSDQTHLTALLGLCRAKGLHDVFIHAFLDGRDTPPTSGYGYVQRLQEEIQTLGIGRIATLTGRFYAMDRDKRWDRIELAYDALTQGTGIPIDDPLTAIEAAYDAGETDEFIRPRVVVEQGQPLGVIRDGDAVCCFNFRADRARQMTQALYDPLFTAFERKQIPSLAFLATMTRYDKDFDLPVLFPPMRIVNGLGEVVSKQGARQIRLAETEKYAHVTYFFNGGREEPFSGENRQLLPSPRDVATYDLQPEMSVHQVTQALCAAIRKGEHRLLICNFANLDMVGHTGSIKAAIAACQAVDHCVGQVMDALHEVGGKALITADHGNAEDMLDDQGRMKTAHSLNPVPCILVGAGTKAWSLRKGGALCDVAPTLLHLLGMNQPQEMTGQSLLLPRN